MKTQISKFCEDYLRVLEPLPLRLQAAVEALEKCADDGITQVPKGRLNDIRARFRSLRDKLQHQHGYLLIFGPLKSGKSTLMNAISEDYVSEVTSLPGYPCLVYVGHSEKNRFSVTHYNGRESVFSDGLILHDIIADSHVALAEQIREAENRGEVFAPQKHFAEAIRRVDMRFPIENLRHSSTVLVDTPGLYSRMNFGYDLLTREFRDSAACAVFVVKTDNLFLEQVFAEFNELLHLFSRIFLVINVDSSKRDLRSDGELVPSAESEKPEEIIEAFRTLSMAAPLRRAYDEGRVRIHAIDLLSAASSFLKKKRANGQPALRQPALERDEADEGPADQPEIRKDAVDGETPDNKNGTEPQHAERQTAAFEGFITDLTEYLNSNDYTRAFKLDSLRQGETLCHEAASVRTCAELSKLGERQEEIQRHVDQLDTMAEALDRLISVDWHAAFEGVRSHNSRRSGELATARASELASQMTTALEEWYQTSESLKFLVESRWRPALVDAGRDLADGSQSRVRSSISNSLGGAEPGGEVMSDLHMVGFSLAPSRDAAAEKLGLNFDPAPYALSLNPEEIPVRKSLADWVLFRSRNAVRERLFGAPNDLSREIPVDAKSKRLSDSSRASLAKIVEKALSERLPHHPRRQAEGLLSRYIDAFCRSVDERLRSRLTEVLEEKQQTLRPFAINASILNALDELHRQTIETGGKIQVLAPRVGASLALNGAASYSEIPHEVES
jgi:hypothetical protein